MKRFFVAAVVLTVGLAACSDSNLLESSSDAVARAEVSLAAPPPGFLATGETPALLLKGSGDKEKMAVCHFNKDNSVQVVTVAGKAGVVHLEHHPGDGFIGSAYVARREIGLEPDIVRSCQLDMQSWFDNR